MLILMGFRLGLSVFILELFTSGVDFLLVCFIAGGVTIFRGATGCPTTRSGAVGAGGISLTPLARDGDLSGLGDVIRLGECLAWLGGEHLGDTLWFWLLMSAL